MSSKQVVANAQRVKTLAEYDAAIADLRHGWQGRAGPRPRIWFRGHRDVGWRLCPLGSRGPFSQLQPSEEHQLFVEFKRRAIGLVDHLPTSNWAWLYLAQHHGLPTRLLDWTESSHVGLFFALQRRAGSDLVPETDACVWVLLPSALNQESWGFSNVVAMRDEDADFLISAYVCGKAASGPAGMTEKHLLAVIPEYVTERLRAQRGAFVVFGDDSDALENLVVKEAETVTMPLARPLVIERGVVPRLLWELDAAGVAESTVFPDINGLCSELARRYDRTAG